MLGCESCWRERKYRLQLALRLMMSARQSSGPQCYQQSSNSTDRSSGILPLRAYLISYTTFPIGEFYRVEFDCAVGSRVLSCSLAAFPKFHTAPFPTLSTPSGRISTAAYVQ